MYHVFCNLYNFLFNILETLNQKQQEPFHFQEAPRGGGLPHTHSHTHTHTHTYPSTTPKQSPGLEGRDLPCQRRVTLGRSLSSSTARPHLTQLLPVHTQHFGPQSPYYKRSRLVQCVHFTDRQTEALRSACSKLLSRNLEETD